MFPRVLKAYPLFTEILEGGLHMGYTQHGRKYYSKPENAPLCTTEAHVYNTISIAEQCHCKNSTSLSEHDKTNPAFFAVLWQDIVITSTLQD